MKTLPALGENHTAESSDRSSILLTSTKDSLDEPKVYMINGLFVLDISFADLE